MTRLARFHAAAAGFQAGAVVDLDLVDDPRIDGAIDGGYVERTTIAEAADAGDPVVNAEEGAAEATPSARRRR